MREVSKAIGCAFKLLLIIVLIAVVSAWLQSQGMSWVDLGRYTLDKGGELITKIGQVILSMDWGING